MPIIEKTLSRAEANERNEEKGAARAAALLELAETRAITPADLFCSLAAMVARQSPNLGGKLLDALELTVRRRPEAEFLGGPLGNVTETAGPTVTVTAPETDAEALVWVPSYDGPNDRTYYRSMKRAEAEVRGLIYVETLPRGADTRLPGQVEHPAFMGAMEAFGSEAPVEPPADVAFEPVG